MSVLFSRSEGSFFKNGTVLYDLYLLFWQPNNSCFSSFRSSLFPHFWWQLNSFQLRSIDTCMYNYLISPVGFSKTFPSSIKETTSWSLLFNTIYLIFHFHCPQCWHPPFHCCQLFLLCSYPHSDSVVIDQQNRCEVQWLFFIFSSCTFPFLVLNCHFIEGETYRRSIIRKKNAISHSAILLDCNTARWQLLYLLLPIYSLFARSNTFILSINSTIPTSYASAGSWLIVLLAFLNFWWCYTVATGSVETHYKFRWWNYIENNNNTGVIEKSESITPPFSPKNCLK